MGAAACGEGDGTLRATDESSGGLVLLPSFRFARPHSELNGRRIFITTGGDLVCEHGELPSTISTWLQREKAAEPEPTIISDDELIEACMSAPPLFGDEADEGGQDQLVQHVQEFEPPHA